MSASLVRSSGGSTVLMSLWKSEVPDLSGPAAWTPAPLDPPEDGHALVCCSRPTSDIALAL